MIVIEETLEMTMRDGTILRADVFRPDTDEKLPVLFRRTPYRKEGWAHVARELASHGYVSIVQDLRGRGASDGEFIWSFAEEAQTIEALDGFDSIACCADYEHSDGRVGTWGHSYDGWSQLRTAILQPPNLSTMHISGITGRSLDMNRGILDVGRRMEWCYTLGADLAKKSDVVEGIPADRDLGMIDRWTNFERGKWLWFLPLADLPPHALTGASKLFQEYMLNTHRELWHFDKSLDKVQVPTAFLTGWWDRFSETSTLYNELVAASPSDLAPRHRLLMGPWSHNPDTFVADLGDVETSGKGAVDLVETLLEWFNGQLKSEEVETDQVITYFNVGTNEWRTATAWPDSESREVSYFIRSSGLACDLAGGGGLLSLERPGTEPTDDYRYDPRDPVMSLMLEDSHHAPKDQAPNDSRPDVLHYQGPTLSKSVDVTGTPRVRLFASTDVPDTDWVVRLIDVSPSGKAINVSGGILRAKYRNSYDEPELLEVGVVYEFLIDMSITSYTFLPGHRMRLDITSSDFPNWDRNHNTGNDYATDGELRIAHQQVHHSGDLATELILPIIPAEGA